MDGILRLREFFPWHEGTVGSGVRSQALLDQSARWWSRQRSRRRILACRQIAWPYVVQNLSMLGDHTTALKSARSMCAWRSADNSIVSILCDTGWVEERQASNFVIAP